jgi:hypothetical protein
MALTLADVERWDAGAVRDVSNALAKRGASAEEVKAGLSKLPLIATWRGSGGDAARASLDKLSAYLAGHADDMARVSAAAGTAADSIEQIKSSLLSIENDAKRDGFSINMVTGEVTPTNPDMVGDPIYALQQADLETRISQLLQAASTTDSELASAVATAGEAPLDRPPVPDLLSQPLPDDPQAFADAWEQLSEDQKEALYEQNPFIGNHDGMPFEDRHRFNERHLGELEQATQSELDRLRAAHPDWAAGDKPFMSTAEWQSWSSQWNAANKASQQYGQVRQALDESSDGIPRYLGVLDDKGHAAVSINNPDEAVRHATFVPGTGQDLSRLEFSTEKAEAMMQATLAADPNLDISDVSVTTWMDYDRPMSVFEAASPGRAHSGADALQDFQTGLRVSHDDGAAGGPSTNTVIGHSYGSTIMGAAGLDGYLDANNVVAVGSPGILAGSASDLNLPADANVFATRAQNDIIGAVTGVTLGPDPMLSKFGAIPFEAAPGQTWPFGLPSIGAHSSYWSDGNPALLNMGKIIAGQTNVTPPTFTP